MTEATAAPDATLDATGLLCPLPVLKARRALKPLAPGAVLEVLATDPGAVKDFAHFCTTTGCELLEFLRAAGRRPALPPAQTSVNEIRKERFCSASARHRAANFVVIPRWRETAATGLRRDLPLG